MNLVLDTNVIVSGLLSPFSPAGKIIHMVVSGEIHLYLDARLLSEYTDVLLRPKFQFDPEMVASFLDYVEHAGIFVSGKSLTAPLPDPDDEPFLEVALVGQAECIVTGNLKHFPRSACKDMKVFSPTQFLHCYKK